MLALPCVCIAELSVVHNMAGDAFVEVAQLNVEVVQLKSWRNDD